MAEIKRTWEETKELEASVQLNFAGYVPEFSDAEEFVRGERGLNTLYLNEGLTCVSGGKTVRGELKLLLEERDLQLSNEEIKSLQKVDGNQAWLVLADKVGKPISLSVRNAGKAMTHVEYIIHPSQGDQPAHWERVA